MPKTPKIDVITVKLTVHIPVDRDDRKAVAAAYKLADSLCEAGDAIGETAAYEARLNRVPAPRSAPEPKAETTEPPDDGLDIPERLRRTAETEPAAAE